MNCFKKSHKPAILITLFAAYCLLFTVCDLQAQTIVKFATLAPEGTAWMKTMRRFNDDIEAKTKGRVKFKIYAGGVSGDEKDVARKIRLGQLQAAGFTGFGLGE